MDLNLELWSYKDSRDTAWHSEMVGIYKQGRQPIQETPDGT